MAQPFDKRLALFAWMLELFEAKDFDDLARVVNDNRFEGFDADNVTHFHHALAARPLRDGHLSKIDLLAYDANIVRHWRAITARRNRAGNALYPKYFQYLALLFTEIYLDRYFQDTGRLLDDLNNHVQRFNSDKAAADKVDEYRAEDLNKLALWNATGSGKTLLMHVNILQYQHYLAAHGEAHELNKIILLTPNEGLSAQHKNELALSNIQGDYFNKNSSPPMYDGKRQVEIIDIHKLKETAREKTVAVEAFEGNNLVLVDEGHRGAGGEDWLGKRNQLCTDGFSFEYSATFGQAVAAANKNEITQLYAKCILFDYSYKFFYADGYGKDYQIFNLADDSHQPARDLYLTACLLAFYQQQRLFSERETEIKPYLIAKPLWVFVGGSVNAVRSEGGRQVSDVLSVLLFLAEFVSDKNLAIGRITQLLAAQNGVVDGDDGASTFAARFEILALERLAPETIYDEILRVICNAPAGGSLHVDNLKGAGELALRVGNNDAFGVINVGDADKLWKLCAERTELIASEVAVASPLFENINKPESCVNLLIGAKKFTEGWDSPRVSTMGLLNVGRREGSQIIQLFGRGVRLRGYAHSLKRSRYIEARRPPAHLEVLETLNIFGVRADYMKQFKEYLANEGLPANENRIEIILPVLHNFGKSEMPKLKMIRVREGINFKRDRAAELTAKPPAKMSRINLDYYPKIAVQAGADYAATNSGAIKQAGKLADSHLAFLDFEQLYFELHEYTEERGWENLHFDLPHIEHLLRGADWYDLLIPAPELLYRDQTSVRLWQGIATTLLKKYLDYFYKFRREEYEKSFLEVRELAADDDNFAFFGGNAEDDKRGYQILVADTEQALIRDLQALREQIENNQLGDFSWRNGGFTATFFARHVYQPLLYLNREFKSTLQIKPVALNDGEQQFVTDLRDYYEQHHAARLADTDLYLLRNMSKGRGIGFFEAGNFHPDFILWLVCDGKQFVTFVDPKGIRNLEGKGDAKITFHRKIKDIETELNDADLTLNSFILATTKFEELNWREATDTLKTYEAEGVLFMKDRPTTYISSMINKILAG